MTQQIDYTTNITAFFRDLFSVENTGGMAPIMPPFFEYWLNRAFPQPTGNPAARNIIDSRSKKQGKSTTAGAIALYMASRKKYAEVVIAASDRDQAKDRVFRAVKFAIENNPTWAQAKVYKDIIELGQGSIIQAIPFDWRGVAGGNYDAVIFDELHTFTTELHRRLFDELVIPPTKPDGVRWIASYAGFLGESTLLWELWQRAIAGRREPGELPIYSNPGSSLLALIDQGESSWRMPWATPEYMAEVKQSERPNTYRRLWLNEWVSNESEFITPEQWAECYSPEVQPLLPKVARRIVLGADASTSRDLTALVGVEYQPIGNLVDVAFIRTWKPRPNLLRLGKPTVDLDETIKAEILRLHSAGQVEAVVYDPYQLHSIAMELSKAGVKMIELPQTAMRVEADQALYDAVISKMIRHFSDPVLNEHINNAVAIETPRGFRLAKERTTRKIDAAVALSMAHWGALNTQKAYGGVTVVADPFANWPPNPGEYYYTQFGWSDRVNERPHPEGVTWENCKHRNKGCLACSKELEDEGYFEQERERYRNRPISQTREEREEMDRFINQLGIGNHAAPMDTKRYELIQNFWKAVKSGKKES